MVEEMKEIFEKLDKKSQEIMLMVIKRNEDSGRKYKKGGLNERKNRGIL